MAEDPRSFSERGKRREREREVGDPNLRENEEAERGIAINGGNKAGDDSVAVSNPKIERPLPYWEEVGARSIWDHLPLHPQVHGRPVRLQVNPKAEVAVQGGLRRRLEGDSDHAPPVRAPTCGADRRDL